MGIIIDGIITSIASSAIRGIIEGIRVVGIIILVY